MPTDEERTSRPPNRHGHGERIEIGERRCDRKNDWREVVVVGIRWGGVKGDSGLSPSRIVDAVYLDSVSERWESSHQESAAVLADLARTNSLETEGVEIYTFPETRLVPITNDDPNSNAG